jgi:hypothetical protein
MSTTTASGSGGRKPSGGDKSSKKDSGHRSTSSSSSIPPSGDGKTAQTATWAPGLAQGSKTYVVNGLGLSPRLRRVNVDEARGWAQVYEILDGDSYEVVAQLPVGPMANPSMPAPTAVQQQLATADAHETLIAGGSGPVSQAYHIAQLQRECLLAHVYVYESSIADDM